MNLHYRRDESGELLYEGVRVFLLPREMNRLGIPPEYDFILNAQVLVMNERFAQIDIRYEEVRFIAPVKYGEFFRSLFAIRDYGSEQPYVDALNRSSERCRPNAFAVIDSEIRVENIKREHKAAMQKARKRDIDEAKRIREAEKLLHEQFEWTRTRLLMPIAWCHAVMPCSRVTKWHTHRA